MGLDIHFITFLLQCVNAKYWTRAFYHPDTLPSVNHMCGMQYEIVVNIALCPEFNEYSCTNLCAQLLHKTATLI